ncbi:hypothetical protein EG329_002306 [Mollisiaceae sp. DMI_Dod_QoI]|nr:hypothetical protein EG329_002306 [Helotiales sp. DMI_Dod_QoI]
MINPILLAGLGLASHATAACTRAMLQDAASAYVTAQISGIPSSITSLSPTASYAENNVTMDITKGILSSPITIDFNRSLLDTTQCATFTEISAATNKKPYVIHTRMLLSPDASQITAIQSVVAKSGDWAFNATSQLYYSKRETWDPIPEAKRDTRAVIKAAGDAYLDSWGDATVKVPYGTPCSRIEGGSDTGASNPNANTCKMPQFPGTFHAGNRRYVVDEELGGVDIFNDFPFIDKSRPDGTPSTNLMRVEGGMLRYIHEVTVCAERNCGR